MIRIFMTGDLHIGRGYKNRRNKEELRARRVKALQTMVEEANSQFCHFFVITGDLFDTTNCGGSNGVKKQEVQNVVRYLSAFRGQVYVLPGNHDYYDPDNEAAVWTEFRSAMVKQDAGNLTLMTQYAEYADSVLDENVVLYPALCRSEHGRENNLGWVRDQNPVSDDTYRIGVAHGALQGLSLDAEGTYFLMTCEAAGTAFPEDLCLSPRTGI